MTGPRAPRPDPPVVAGPWAGLSPRGRRTHSWDPAKESDWFDDPVALLELAEARRPGLARFVAPRAAYMAVTLAALFGAATLITTRPEVRSGISVAIAVLMWAVWTAVWLWLLRRQTLYADAERLGDGESVHKIVDLYALAEVRLTGTGPATRLHLVGDNRVQLRLPMGLVEGNPALWRLVYHGLHHSAACGARIDPDTHARLALPEPMPLPPAP